MADSHTYTVPRTPGLISFPVFLFVCFCLFIYLLFIYFEAGSYCAALTGLRILVPLTQPLSMAVNTGSTPWLTF